MRSDHRLPGVLVALVAMIAGACSGRAKAPTVSERPTETAVAESTTTVAGRVGI